MRAHSFKIVFLTAAILRLAPALCAQNNLAKADAAYRTGVAALAKNDLSRAREQFEQVVRLAPQAEQGYSALGAVLVRLGETERGIRDLKKAIAILPSDNSAQLNLAIAYTQIGATEQALALFARLDDAAKTSGHPLSASATATYARALAPAKLDAAIARMQTAIAQEPGNAEWYDELGSLYAQGRQWPQAAQSFRHAIELNHQSATAHFHLGVALEKERNADAIGELKLAAQLAPKDEQIKLETGKALIHFDHAAEAFELLQSALATNPASLDAAYQLALAYQLTGNPQAAIPFFEKVAAAEPQNAEALTNLGMAYMQEQRAKDAVIPLQNAVRRAPGMVTAHEDLAAAYIQLNQIGDAVEQLHAALLLAPDMPALHYNLGLAFKMEDDASSAITQLEMAEKLNPEGHEAPYVLGVLYMQTGRYKEAAKTLDRSLRLQPQNGDGWADLGSVYAKLERYPEAAAALQQAIALAPDQPDPHLTMATVLIKQGKPAEAATERKLAADLMRTHMNQQRAEVATNSANNLLQSGKVDEAIAQFKEALTYDSKSAAALKGLASALDRKGDTFGAAAERQKAQARQTPQP